MTAQPSFHCIANIGDATPLVYGGAFVLVDLRGCYDPELLILEPEGSDRYGDPTSWERYAIICDRLTAIKNKTGEYVALSDNPFHVDHPAWFGTEEDLQSLASFAGMSVHELVLEATSSNPVHRASFYRRLLDCHGPVNFEAEPEEMSRKEAKALCLAMAGQIVEARSWHDGWIIE
jgi:hypothetical protein